jgi:hypothetical protein
MATLAFEGTPLPELLCQFRTAVCDQNDRFNKRKGNFGTIEWARCNCSPRRLDFAVSTGILYARKDGTSNGSPVGTHSMGSSGTIGLSQAAKSSMPHSSRPS